MHFATGVASKAVFWLILLSSFENQIFSHPNKCYNDCDVVEAKYKAERNGELVCAIRGRKIASTSCRIKCHGMKPDEDQLQCWKKYCAAESLGFCEKPGTPSIYKDQCEEYLNEGKVKYYGVYCPDLKNYEKTPSENRTVDSRAAAWG